VGDRDDRLQRQTAPSQPQSTVLVRSGTTLTAKGPREVRLGRVGGGRCSSPAAANGLGTTVRAARQRREVRRAVVIAGGGGGRPTSAMFRRSRLRGKHGAEACDARGAGHGEAHITAWAAPLSAAAVPRHLRPTASSGSFPERIRAAAGGDAVGPRFIDLVTGGGAFIVSSSRLRAGPSDTRTGSDTIVEFHRRFAQTASRENGGCARAAQSGRDPGRGPGPRRFRGSDLRSCRYRRAYRSRGFATSSPSLEGQGRSTIAGEDKDR